MRALKIVGIAIGALIALVVVTLLLVLIFVDPNDFRDDIERLVERQTGRELTLSGDLKLSVFPWVALELGPASLGDAPGFGDEPFVSIEEARLGVRLLPLLRGTIEVGHVRLVGARVRLVTDEQGRRNWEDLGGGDASDTDTEDETSQRSAQLPTIAGLEVRDAAIVLENRQEQSRDVIRNFNLRTGRLESGKPFKIDTDFLFEQGASLVAEVRLAGEMTADLEQNAYRLAEPAIDVTVRGEGYPADGIPIAIRAQTLAADVAQDVYRLTGLELTATWKGEELPKAGVPITLTASDVQADLGQQTLQLTALDMNVAGTHLKGALKGEQILDAPRLHGPLELDPVPLRDWLTKLGIDAPATQDPKALGRLSFSSQVTLTQQSAELADIVLQLDDTTAKGMFGIADFDSKALRFDLHVDRIDADRYLPPASDEPVAEDEETPSEIPVDALRELNAQGQLTIGEAIFAGMTFSNLRLGVNARNGKVRLHPSEASMYGGRYSGDITIDATGEAARISLDEHVSGIDFAPLFKDFFETERVSGKGSLNLKVTGVGRTTDEIVKTLTGTLDFEVADGALEGVDLWYEIRRARALLRRQPVPAQTGPARTPFTALSGAGTMKNGVLSNHELAVAMQYLRVTGQGTVDLPKETLDYNLVATVLRIPSDDSDAAEMQELVDAKIPIRITGTLTDPKVRPDIEGYVKGKVQERVEEQRQKLEEKVKEKIGDKLKDLFRR